jgi:uncharacterized surface protein with fasciclin (FAS1) repeats
MRLIPISACRSIALGLAVIVSATAAPALASPGTLLEVASSRKNLTTFVACAKMAGLADTLSSSSAEYTVFAPTDEWFAQLPAEHREAMMRDPARLRAWLQHFIVPGRTAIHSPEGDLGESKLPTVAGDILEAKLGKNNDLSIGGARVVAADIDASNGLLDTIDHIPVP